MTSHSEPSPGGSWSPEGRDLSKSPRLWLVSTMASFLYRGRPRVLLSIGKQQKKSPNTTTTKNQPIRSLGLSGKKQREWEGKCWKGDGALAGLWGRVPPPEPQGPRTSNPVDLSRNGWAIVQKNARKSRGSLLQRGWGSSSWPGNSKLASGGWPGGWGGKASQLLAGRQGTASLCPFVSLLFWDHSLCAGGDWGLSDT